MSCEAWRGAVVCLFWPQRGALAMPDSGGGDFKKYYETIGRLEVARALDCNAAVVSSYVICVFCMLGQCRA